MYTLRDEVLGYGTCILPDMLFEGFIYQLKNGDIFLIHHVIFVGVIIGGVSSIHFH